MIELAIDQTRMCLLRSRRILSRVALLPKYAYRSATTSFRITVRISNRVILTGLLQQQQQQQQHKCHWTNGISGCSLERNAGIITRERARRGKAGRLARWKEDLSNKNQRMRIEIKSSRMPLRVIPACSQYPAVRTNRI